MFLQIKKLSGLMVLSALLLVQNAFGFSFYGPTESWQTANKNHVERWFYGSVNRASSDTFSFVFTGIGPPAFDYGGTTDLGGSKNLGDEWRLNTPIITYAIDSSFYDYFGATGAKAIDQAMAIMNRIPPASRTSADLSEFLTEGNQRINQRAQALQLIDLKSTVLSIMVERLGLFGETHVFDMHERVAYPGTCNFNYVTVVRNFDPVTWEPTHFVNGTLYTYDIVDLCPTDSADSIERIGNTTAFQFTAVATQEGLVYGGYYLNITRDDMGGIKYLYRRNNYNNEALPADAIVSSFGSPWAPPNLLFTNALQTNTTALRGGIEKVTFVKTSFDSVFGTGFTPRLISYSLPIVTNYHLLNQAVRRRITRPDIVFKAQDLTGGIGNLTYQRSAPLIISNSVPNLNGSGAGPGSFGPQATIIFNKAGLLLLNATPFFLDEATSTPSFQWGSFDGSTNEPVVYPQGSSIMDIEAQVLNAPLVPPPDVGVYNPPF